MCTEGTAEAMPGARAPAPAVVYKGSWGSQKRLILEATPFQPTWRELRCKQRARGEQGDNLPECYGKSWLSNPEEPGDTG